MMDATVQRLEQLIDKPRDTETDLYKHTDVGVVPADWDVLPIRRVCKLINGRGFKPYEWRDLGLPIIRIQNLNGSGEFNHYDGRYDKKIEVPPGQLLFAWSGSRGTSFGPHIWRGPLGLLNYHTWKVEIDTSQIDPEFFYHALKRLTKTIEDRAHGASALVHTQKWEMEGFLFPAPSQRSEQCAIASMISDVDALIEELERLVVKKRQIMRGAVQELFERTRQLPGHSAEWRELSLGAICTTIVDGTHFTPSYVEDGVPFYSVENVTSNDFGNTKFISREEHLSLIKRCKPERGDILLTRIGSIGDTKLIDWDVDASIYVSLALLKCGSLVSPKFLYFYTKSDKFRRSIEDRSLLNAIPKKINMQDISGVPILIPTLSEQKEIADILEDLETDTSETELRLTKLYQIRQGLMQDLLSGRVRLV